MYPCRVFKAAIFADFDEIRAIDFERLEQYVLTDARTQRPHVEARKGCPGYVRNWSYRQEAGRKPPTEIVPTLQWIAPLFELADHEPLQADNEYEIDGYRRCVQRNPQNKSGHIVPAQLGGDIDGREYRPQPEHCLKPK